MLRPINLKVLAAKLNEHIAAATQQGGTGPA
jgi:hypothetical protein